MMNIKKFNGLTKSEITKIEKAAAKIAGEKCCVESWYTGSRCDCDIDTGFQDVIVNVTDRNYSRSLATVTIAVCLWDRRRSFVANL